MKLSNSTLLARSKKHRGHRGVVLVVALIMLLVMTSIGVTLITGSTLQERMAGNNRQAAIARSNAEFALKEAEEEIVGFTTGGGISTVLYDDFSANFAGTQQGKYITVPADYNPNPTGPSNVIAKDLPANTDLATWTGSFTSSTAQGASNVTTPSEYVIEFIGSQNFTGGAGINVGGAGVASKPPSFVFRITAIGYGQNTNITSILQSIYTTGQGI